MSDESNNPANKIENKDSLLVLDILVAEKQIIPQYREDIVLYTKTKEGKYIAVAEYWRTEVNEIIKEIFRKKKMKYGLIFTHSLQHVSGMKPYTVRLLMFMMERCRRANILEGNSVRDMRDIVVDSERYIMKAIRELMDCDFVRREKNKNGFNYMINPGFYTRCTYRSIFTLIQRYSLLESKSKIKLDFTTFEE